MPTRNFRIVRGNTANGELKMLGGGRGDTDAREKYVMLWEVAPSINVTSIESIELKTQPNGVLFSSLGPTDAPANRHWKGVIRPGVPSRDYLYSIFWNTTPPALQPYEHDPKIAIKPPKVIPFGKVAVGSLLLLGFLGLSLLSRRNKGK